MRPIWIFYRDFDLEMAVITFCILDAKTGIRMYVYLGNYCHIWSIWQSQLCVKISEAYFLLLLCTLQLLLILEPWKICAVR